MGSQAVFVHEGAMIDYTAGADIDAGQIVVDNTRCYVAKSDIDNGDLGALATGGVFKVDKTGGGGITFSMGDAVYFSDSTGVATATDTDTYFGVAVADATDAATVVYAKLCSFEEGAAEKTALASLSDVGTSTATAGNVLIADGTDFDAGKLGVVSVGNSSSGESIPVMIHAVCSAGGAEDEVVHAGITSKVRILRAWMISRDTSAANVTLSANSKGQAITSATAKGTDNDTVVEFDMIAAGDELTAGWDITATFSAAAAADICLLCVPIA